MDLPSAMIVSLICNKYLHHVLISAIEDERPYEPRPYDYRYERDYRGPPSRYDDRRSSRYDDRRYDDRRYDDRRYDDRRYDDRRYDDRRHDDRRY